MLRKILLPSIFVLLTYGFWVSPDFKEIAAGVSVFLFGMFFLEEGFRAFTGGTLEQILRNSTDRMWKSISFGAITTTVMQSSSLVSVITISFLSAGLIDLAGGLGIIFGANLGTTTGAWLVAGFGLKVKISAYAMPMLVFGSVMYFQKSPTLKGIGFILAGLGFLFLGIHHMKEGFVAFKDNIDLVKYAMPGYRGLFIFAGIGVIATVIMQSSHATLVIIITALAAKQITYENALALAVGANVGTTITAILGSMNSNIEGKRLAGGHLVFNLASGGIAIAAMPLLTEAVDRISGYCGIATDDYTLKLAVFHTLFNAIGVIVMLPLTGLLVRSLVFWMPGKEISSATPRFLNDAVLEFPDTMLSTMRKELFHLYDSAFEIFAHGINMHRNDLLSNEELEQLVAENRKLMAIDIDQRYSRNVKGLYAAIVEFGSKSQQFITPERSEQLRAYRNAGQHLVEAVKAVKHMNKNMCRFLNSSNLDIRNEYDILRRRLALILRDIGHLSEEDEESRPLALSYIENMKARLEMNDILSSGRIDNLIRHQKISPEMATSLLNDWGYLELVIQNLLSFSEAMFRSWSKEQKEVEKEFELTSEERSALSQQRAVDAKFDLTTSFGAPDEEKEDQ